MSASPLDVKLTGMTWEHVRGHGCLVAADPFLQSHLGITVDWTARSLLAFGDQKIEEFYQDFDLMVIDYPHIPDAVAAGTVLPFEDFVSAADLDQLAQESVGGSHHSYLFRNKHWALALDAASQVSAYRPDRADSAPLTWNDAKEIGKAGKLLWPYKPVDAFSTFATLCAQLGAPLAGGKNFIDNQVAAQALELMIEFTHLVPDFCATFNPIDTAEALADDEPFTHAVAKGISFPWT
jgi:multiple sugar transport system substrate-binding protein